MGLWMESRGKRLLEVRCLTLLIFLVAKLVLVPFVMLGLALAADLDDVPGRAAVLIASLPISMASFSLGSNYNIGQSILSANVAFGTILLLPTVLLWNIVLDWFDIFPIPS